jgi:hypothetical protein
VGRVILDLSMSLDGFVAGTNVDVERPLGEQGEIDGVEPIELERTRLVETAGVTHLRFRL